MLEKAGQEVLDRGCDDPSTETFTPFGHKLGCLPDDEDELRALAAAGQTMATAKLTLKESRRRVTRAFAEHRVQQSEVMSHVMSLERVLKPLAFRRIPSLPDLVGRTVFSVSEDAEVERAAAERLLREHGHEPCSSDRRQRKARK